MRQPARLLPVRRFSIDSRGKWIPKGRSIPQSEHGVQIMLAEHTHAPYGAQIGRSASTEADAIQRLRVRLPLRHSLTRSTLRTVRPLSGALAEHSYFRLSDRKGSTWRILRRNLGSSNTFEGSSR